MRGNSRDMKENSSCSNCQGGFCGMCRGTKLLIAGLVLIANALWPFASWGLLIGILIAVGGLIKMSMHGCGHCK